MARRQPSKTARNNNFPRCTGMKVAMLDEGLLAIAFITEDTKKRKNRSEPIIVDEKHAQNLMNTLESYMYADETPNAGLIASMREAEKYKRSGKMKWYDTVDEFMNALLN